jgi:hypothetical protein
MKPGSCARLFEVEAMRDGRLHGAELASFGRHLTACAVCLREVQALEALGEALRAPPGDEAGGDELHAQRERTRLLAAFDRGLITPAHGRGARRRLLWPAVAAAAVVGLLVFWRARPDAQPAPTAGVVVRADHTAVWSRRSERRRQEIELRRGALWIKVDHAAGDGPLVVLLPDGELEDIGTTFTVSADGGRTTRVVVHEGRVLLRLRGRPPVAIDPGDTWTPETLPATAPLAPPPATTPPLAPPSPPRTAARARPVSSRAPALPDPAVHFRAAMAALDAGDNREAAAAFTAFLGRHPRDPRAEDAAYLRVIALQRLGAHAELQRAAAVYLRRHPAGFRRPEVERLTRNPASPGR